MIHIARQHDLPTRYVRFYKAIEPTPDLDTDRNQLNLSITERQLKQQRTVVLRPIAVRASNRCISHHRCLIESTPV